MEMLDRFTASAAGLFAAGLALVVLSILRGEGSAGIAICVPFFYGTGLFSSLGVLCFFAGAAMLFLGLARGAEGEAGPEGGRGTPGQSGQAGAAPASAPTMAPRMRFGGVILIGPVPIVLGSDPGMSRTMFYIALGLMAAMVVALLALAIL